MNKVPRRGEIWNLCFDPTVGSEMKKTRPAVILSSDAMGKLPVKLVAPLTEWDEKFSRNVWHVPLAPDAANGLKKISAVDVLQSRCVSWQRFVEKLGVVPEETMRKIVAALLIIVEYEEKKDDDL